MACSKKGKRNQRKRQSRPGQNFAFWDRFEVSHFDSAVSKLEHAPEVLRPQAVDATASANA